jgi:hypothetical protein
MKMKALILLPLMLTACVNDDTEMSIAPGKWANYHAMMVGLASASVESQAAPESVKSAYANCIADFIDQHMTVEERQYLDHYAQGDQEMTVRESKSLDRTIRTRAGVPDGPITSANIDILSNTCPNDVPSFRQYLKL